ncbi:non-ribosomal peptide synthetase [Streptomyces sp. DSM 40750]|uniref:non-ribosomal peptide synthetase n=1 Tax=Streptomyces sp. DSM 40750 TaxID=2801030 RepID=UPI00214AABB8|nr:non-ribosomal peptide synthetase [Streptomyces sp. DSM 40750]UUU22856.1 amino acid adenylation domain-containing protein [Streptomyces sp. DSM 40750]
MNHPSNPFAAEPLHEVIARRAASSDHALAVVAGGRALTYGELDRRANRLAHLLLRTGAGPDAPVGVLLNRGTRLAVTLLAVWKTGAAYVPLDPGHPAARTSAVLADTGAAVVVTGPDTAERFEGSAVRTVALDADARALDGLPQDAPAVAVSGAHPAYVLHTSGSTGRPKGVVISHEGLANQVGWRVRAHGLGPGDRVLHKTPLTFDAAGWEIFAPLAGGGTVVMAPTGAERDPALLVRTVNEHRVTVLQVVPSVLRMLVDEPAWRDCATLRLLSSGGEQLHAELVQRFLRAMGDRGAEVEVWNTYGPTECTNEVTGHRFDPIQRSGPVPIGTPVDGIRTVVADPAGHPVEPGHRGELYLGGIGLAHGYLGQARLTAERFVPDPFGPPGGRLYRTGDLVRQRADGSLEYLGRTDHQVKINGVRIEPAEVEAALAGHPGIREAAVTSYKTPTGDTRLAAYLLSRPDEAPTAPEALREFLAGRLPESHLPSVYVEMASFPRTSSGKLDRLALPAPDATGNPEAVPTTDAERLVAGLWRELFHAEDIGVHDDFFRLGGSSLQLTRLANRLRAATGRDIELPRLLRATTVAAQARLIAVEDDGTERAEAPAVRPVPRTGGLPLSLGQRRLWLLDRINPRSREWVTGLFLRVPATDGEPLVRRALDELTTRHEALRTRFVADGGQGGEPSQLIDPPGPMTLRTVTAPRARVGELVERDAAEGFDLEHGPVARALLISEPDTGPTAEAADRTLVLLMHHIVGDGWSATVLREEFHEILGALRAGRRPELPELAVQYADYAVWQRERLTEDVVARELDHWRTVLDGAAPLALRTDRPRPPARDARGSVVTFTVPADIAEGLTELGRRGDATPFMVLLTAFTTLLARYTGQWDVAIGTPVAGRERPEIEGVVGFFLNSLVLRCPLDGSLAFEQALERVREVCKDAFGHQELPFEELVAALAPERDLSRTPLYQVAFDYHGEELTGSAADADELDAVTEVSSIAKTDLTLYMRGQPDGTLVGALEYATSLFERATVERLAGHFRQLLESVVTEPLGRLDTLDLLPDDERLALSAPGRHNHTPAPDVTASVPALFAARAAAVPDATALVADGATATFAELDTRANQLAHLLRGLGVGPESVVGVLLDRGIDLPVTLLAVWKAGAAYLPLDPSFPVDRVGGVLADARARVVVTRSEHRERLADVFPGRFVATDDDADLIAAQPGSPPARPAHLDPGLGRDLDLPAYVIYTSGSTGRPKGVQITHRGLANHVRWAVEELASRGTGGGAVFSSVAFDLVVPNLWAPLLAGLPTHLLPQDLDLAELGTRLRSAAPFSFLKLTPGHMEILARQLDPEVLAGLAGVIVVAGEALPVRRADEWARTLGAGRLINEYGPTEASVGTCVYPVTAPVSGESVPIGRPLPGVTMHVLDDLMRPAPTGVVGELYVGGLGVARGYAARPELTAACFVPDPYGPAGARLYRTGDVVRLLPDGHVDFVGRRDSQVKIRGYRVELGEIKSVLDAHPAVAEAVVTAVEDADGNTGLAAYWVPAPGVPERAETREELAAHVAERLPGYMVPRTFTPIARVPLNANGKLDRAALPKPREAAADDLVEPRGVVEERIAEIFEELLGVRAGAHSHFFRSGGNSILAIRLIAEIQQAFDIDFPTRAVFEGGTVAELAEVVETEVRAEIDQMSQEDLMAEALEWDEHPSPNGTT